MNTSLAQLNIALPVQAAHQLPVRAASQPSLVTDLWLDDGAGLIGGEPKC